MSDFAFGEFYVCGKPYIVVQQVTALSHNGLRLQELREHWGDAGQSGFELLLPALEPFDARERASCKVTSGDTVTGRAIDKDVW